MHKLMKLAIGAVAPLMAVPASAATYTFSFTPFPTTLFGPTFSGSGTFTTSDTAMTVGNQTAFAITGITGTINGQAITNAAGGNYGNYFTTGAYFLDGSGVNITTTGMKLNFFNQSNNMTYRINRTDTFNSFYVNATSAPAASAVPEAATWAMLVLGFGVAGYALRRRPTTSVRRAVVG